MKQLTQKKTFKNKIQNKEFVMKSFYQQPNMGLYYKEVDVVMFYILKTSLDPLDIYIVEGI